MRAAAEDRDARFEYVVGTKGLDKLSKLSKVGEAASVVATPTGRVYSVATVAGRQTPAEWIWHHYQDPGVMRLVPKYQHTPGSIFWDALHPGGRGGYSIWSIPAGAPPN